MSYEFTNDWFKRTAHGWSQFPKAGRVLEIGSYEGQSAVWIIENMLTDDGILYCVDTWAGGEDHQGIDFDQVETRFETNVKKAKRSEQKIYKLKDESYRALATIITGAPEMDFIYIDGSHVAKDVLTDACMAWPLLRQGGLMVFDDYMWGDSRDILHRPKMAIDAFVNIFAEEAQLVGWGAQTIVRKR
jgi:predicted O-methyltransferase YrrM